MLNRDFVVDLAAVEIGRALNGNAATDSRGVFVTAGQDDAGFNARIFAYLQVSFNDASIQYGNAIAGQQALVGIGAQFNAVADINVFA